MTASGGTVTLIPAYEPDDNLVRLVASIRAGTGTVVVIDDGSGREHAQTFDAVRALGGDVIGYPVNRGKGHALKHGFAHIAARYPGSDVVCADGDGQHTVGDLRLVADELLDHRDSVVLGARRFDGEVPAKSRFGNDLTRVVFRCATGRHLQDTQTGLRGYPAWMLGWLLSIDGARYEYEMEVLLAAKRAGIGFREVPVQTVYLDGNASSHFRPIRDSIRVYVTFLRFGLSSVTAFALKRSPAKIERSADR
jgi:glycosyltransferase involved in cell wall biosynthesis